MVMIWCDCDSNDDKPTTTGFHDAVLVVELAVRRLQSSFFKVNGIRRGMVVEARSTILNSPCGRHRNKQSAKSVAKLINALLV